MIGSTSDSFSRDGVLHSPGAAFWSVVHTTHKWDIVDCLTDVDEGEFCVLARTAEQAARAFVDWLVEMGFGSNGASGCHNLHRAGREIFRLVKLVGKSSRKGSELTRIRARWRYCG